MLLLAAGRGERLGGEHPKAFLRCRGVTLLERSLSRLAALGLDSEIVVAVHPDDRSPYLAPQLEQLRRAGLSRVVDGGASRQESMRRALDAADPACEIVLIHDAARPFFPLEQTRAVVTRAAECGAAVLAIPAPDTLKRVGDDGRVIETVDRRGIWLAQTPQAAQRALLVEALERAEREGFQGTDDVSLLENAGTPVEVVPGSPLNLKITTPHDLELAELLATRQDGRQDTT